jgi:DNA-directed RNA polymerase specialized sigma24 family protein
VSMTTLKPSRSSNDRDRLLQSQGEMEMTTGEISLASEVYEKLDVKRNKPSSSTISDTNAILEKQHSYIVALARQKVPWNIVHPDVLKDEIDELVQSSLIKLWLALRKKEIVNPRGYINSIVRTQVVDMVRRHKPCISLPLDEEGELYHGNASTVLSEGLQDPVQEFESDESVVDWIEEIAGNVLALPPCQQRAIICSLKDYLEDNHLLLRLLKSNGIDIEGIQWPHDKDELRSIRSSLSIARKKMRALKGSYSLL